MRDEDRAAGGGASAPEGESSDALIDSLYDIAIDPDRYDALMSIWGRHISAFAERQPDHAPSGGLSYSSEAERHFARALGILERIGRPGSDDPETLVRADPKPALLVGRDGRIVTANAAAAAELGAAAGGALADLPIDGPGITALTRALGRLAAAGDDAVICVAGAYGRSDNRRIVMALTRVARDPLAPPMGKLIAVDVAWSLEAARQIAGAFGLSRAELDIAHAFVSGLSLGDLADRKKRSLATVRTQAKSLLRKTGLHSQLELIRLFAGFTMLRGGGASAPAAEGQGFRSAHCALPDGRALQYGVMGDPGGRPIMLLHGMLTGIRMTEAAEAAFAARGLKVIAPWRPAFAGSSPDPRPLASAPQRFAGDIAVLMDHLGIATCPLIGHMSGSIFAFAASAALKERVSGLVNVSGIVPLKSARQISLMTPRQRIVAYTARFAPRIFPAIVRAGIAQMDSGGMEKFIDALYRNAPHDLKITHDPEIFALMDTAYRETVAQGSRAFEIDGLFATRDWSASVEQCAAPVVLMHAVDDPVIHISTVNAFAARHPAMRLRAYADRGHLLMHTAPSDIAAEAAALLP